MKQSRENPGSLLLWSLFIQNTSLSLSSLTNLTRHFLGFSWQPQRPCLLTFTDVGETGGRGDRGSRLLGLSPCILRDQCSRPEHMWEIRVQQSISKHHSGPGGTASLQMLMLSSVPMSKTDSPGPAADMCPWSFQRCSRKTTCCWGPTPHYLGSGRHWRHQILLKNRAFFFLRCWEGYLCQKQSQCKGRKTHDLVLTCCLKIGRASCRERVCLYV